MRTILPVLFGITGTAILLWLGVWQVQRMAWKDAVLNRIDARIVEAPVAVPDVPSEARDEYLSVAVSGLFGAESADVLVSTKGRGPGFRVITPVETADGRRILVDRGFVPEARKDAPRKQGAVTVTGNLLWPDEVDGYTPAPDPDRNIWFARDLTALARALGTEPILVVARKTAPPDAPITPFPVDSTGIANDHLNYAITWFSLAAIWVTMTGYFLWRQRRPNR